MKAQTNSTIIGRQLQRTLRNQMTDAEIRLWQRLRSRQLAGYKFRRQHPYLDFVLDFVCLEKRLIVEFVGWVERQRSPTFTSGWAYLLGFATLNPTYAQRHFDGHFTTVGRIEREAT